MSLLGGDGGVEAYSPVEDLTDEEPCGAVRPPRGRRRWQACAGAAGLGLLSCALGAAACAALRRSAAAGRARGDAWAPTRTSLPLVQLSSLGASKDSEEGKYKTAYLTSAAHPYKCLHILGKPKNGVTLQIWDCPVDGDLVTKFLVPVGVVGPLRPVEAPDLCLDSPEGYKLQLWSCKDVEQRRSIERVRFLVRAEESTWLRYDHYDLPNEQDVEQMSAEDLGAVMDHVKGSGYAGFAVWHGQAWIKGVQGLNFDDLHDMGLEDPVVFYLLRPEGDFTIRSAHDPGLCVGTPGKIPKNGDVLHLMSCGVGHMYERLEETRFRLHYAEVDEVEQERLHRFWTGDGQRTASPLDAGRAEKPPEVMVSMTLTNIDFGLLKENPELMAMVKVVIREEVASAAGNGISPASITPVLTQGSVKVQSIVHVPEGVSVASVASSLEGSRRKLSAAIPKRVNDLPGIDEVTTGVVGAEHHGVRAHAPKGPPLAAIWSWIAALLAAIVVGMCCVAAYLQRTRLRSIWAQNWARMMEQVRSRGGGKSTALSVYKTREPVVDIDAPGVWRLGRIVDRARPEQATYDVDLDSCGGGRAARLAIGYGPVNAQPPVATLPG